MTGEEKDESGYVPPDVESHDVEPVAVEYREPDLTSHDVEAPPAPEYVPPFIHEDDTEQQPKPKQQQPEPAAASEPEPQQAEEQQHEKGQKRK